MSLNSSTSWPEGPLVLLCCGVNRLIGFLSSVARFIAIAMGKGCLWPGVLDLSGEGTFSLVLTLFIFKAPNYVLARTLTERVV